MSRPRSSASPWRVVARKELRETLRDRRTIIPMVVLPVVLYPAIFLLLFQVASAQQSRLEAQDSRVVAVGPAALAQVLSPESPFELVPPPEPVEGAPGGGEPERSPRIEAIERAILAETVDAALVWPDDAADVLARGEETAVATVYFDPARERSRLARDRVEDALSRWSTERLHERLDARGLPRALARPAELRAQSVASPARMGGWALGQILPLFVVVMVSLGAFYPAVDLTAGERERGTLLTLLTAPIPATQAVAGKFLAVLALAVMTAAFNIGSMALFFGHGASLFPEIGDRFEVSLPALSWLGLLVTAALLGALLSALMMAVAVLARTFKEAQSYLTPVYLLTVIPAVVAQLPGIELSGGTLLAPGVNAALLIKGFLLGGVDPQHVFLVWVSNVVYTAAALALAARLFQRENVVLGEGGWRELFARRGGPAGALGPADALGLFALCFVLFYYGSGWLAAALDLPLLLAVALPLLLFVAAPTLAYVGLRGVAWRESLGLARPSASALAAALVLGVSTWAPLGWVVQRLQEPTLPLPVEQLEQFAGLLRPPDGPLGLLAWLAALALAPALFEELLFRGAVLRGLLRGVRPLGAVLLAAALFAAMHLSLYRFLGTFALGAVAGLLAWRSGSLWPAVLFHLVNNGSVLMFAYLSLGGEAEGAAEPWTELASAASFSGEVALAALPVVTAGLWWVSRLRLVEPARVDSQLAAAGTRSSGRA